MKKNIIINCLDCGVEIVKVQRTIRCKPCQTTVNKARQKAYGNDPIYKAIRLEKNRAKAAEKRLLKGKPFKKFTEIKDIPTKKDIPIKLEFLRDNKPQMIAFLEAVVNEKDEDIDLLWCDKFIEFITPFYPSGHNQRYNYKAEVNWYITKIIEDYSK